MRISEIRNSQQFQDLCQLLLAAEYSDFQALDDSSGDKGSDGYVPSMGRLFAIYCPEKHPTPKTYFQRKIRSDLAKAVALCDKYGYQINEWIFITPAPLSEELHRYIAEQVKKAGLTAGISWSEKNLLRILQRHSELEPLLPDLFTADLRREMHSGIADLLAGQTAVKSSVDALIARGTLVDAAEAKLAGRIKAEYEKRFQSAKQRFDAGMVLQARDAFVEILRDPAARLIVRSIKCGDMKLAIGWFRLHLVRPTDSRSRLALCVSNVCMDQECTHGD